MQYDTSEERYAIKFYFKLWKNPTETYGMLQTAFRPSCMNRALFLSCIRDSREAGSLWGMMRGVCGVRKSIHKNCLAKGLGLGLGILCWDYKGVQEKIRSEEASTLLIGSVAFPQGQYTSFTTPSLSRTIWPRWTSRQFFSLAPCDFCLFPKLRACRYETIEEMNGDVTKVIDTLTEEDFHGAF